MKIKVCGMKHNTEEVAALGPDYLGFIFWSGSPRNFTGKAVTLPEAIGKVGVFVDAELSFITEMILAHKLQLVQLHGSESPAYCESLRDTTETSRPAIIKAFSIGDTFDFASLSDYEDLCDYFLFDTRGRLPGGNGIGFNWEVLRDYPSAKPYFLSGGIGPGDAARLSEFLSKPESKHCHAVDINSCFETAPGLKDPALLIPFFNSIRRH